MRGGFKLLPETIEVALQKHPAVSAAAVVGLRDRRLGQVPAAAVQVRNSVTPPSISELETFLREHVLATHIPTAWRLVTHLPRTASFKIDRPAVVQLFEAAASVDG
jgi:acyl-coenzyme A synthetase/AMP-(fatty) acid ligase